MKTVQLVAKVDSDGKLIIADDLRNMLGLQQDEMVELTVRKIISKKTLNRSENPLYEFTK
jgi:bifunctional DNA-binding transcriptional regulator/antitoxin component of YhaV-PrlF toxin-antitoxin module